MNAILSGKETIPPQGARFDVAFEGRSIGRLSGRVRGVDFIWARADWRIELDIRATLETDDGQRIALSGTGLATPRTGAKIADLIESVSLTTAAPDCVWVNTRQIWCVGVVDLAVGKILIDGYLQGG
jgi:hypothetical protein